MTECYSLSRHLDSAAAPPLAADLLGLRGADLTIDCSDVAFVGALGLQVLIAARRQWSEDGHILSIKPVGGALAKAATALGVDLALIGADHEDTSISEYAS